MICDENFSFSLHVLVISIGASVVAPVRQQLHGMPRPSRKHLTPGTALLAAAAIFLSANASECSGPGSGRSSSCSGAFRRPELDLWMAMRRDDQPNRRRVQGSAALIRSRASPPSPKRTNAVRVVLAGNMK